MATPPNARTASWACGLLAEAKVLVRTMMANAIMPYQRYCGRGNGWLASMRRGTSRNAGAGCSMEAGECTGKAGGGEIGAGVLIWQLVCNFHGFKRLPAVGASDVQGIDPADRC